MSYMDREALLNALSSFKGRRILVLGDLMLDRFTWGQVSRISPEAPVPVVEVEKEDFLLGGAANVAHNLRQLGASVLMAGVIGDDDSGAKVLEISASIGIDTSAVIKDSRPTTLKVRVIAQGQQVVRVDRESRDVLSDNAISALRSLIMEHRDSIEGVIVSDYAKGVVCNELMDLLRDAFVSRGIPVLVDPKPVNKDLYRGVTLVAPNQLEAQALASMPIQDDETLDVAIKTIQKDLEVDAVLITRGSNGMCLWQADSGMFSVPTMAREVYDVTGAGDTVMATLVLAKITGLDWCNAACLANAAAGIVVGRVGTATVTGDDLVNLLRRTK